MKFTEHLAAHITPEWRKQYISYEEMKTMLYGAVERAPSAEVVEQSVITRYLASFDEEFFQYCDKELAKINTFYSEKLAEATRKFSNLKSELNNYISKLESHRLSGSGAAGGGGGRLGLMRAFDRQAQEVKIHTRKIHDLKLAFSEFYLSLILLQNYQNLNFTGFRKILKKHDKLLGTNLGAQWRQSNVEAAPFYTNKDIDRLIQETESLVTTMLEGGDRQKAMKRLRVPPLGDQQSPWVTFKVGLFSGAYIVLIIAVILSGVFSQTRDDWRIVFRLYRGTLLIILFMFLIGVNVYGWRTSGVNHVLIFELDPRNHLSEQHLMEMAAIFGVLWALSVLAFLYSGPLAIPTYANPLALLLLMLVFLVNPLHTMRHQARFWLLRVLGRIFAAPFFYVGFADFWLADQLNSLVPVFIDAQYFVCFYATDFQWMENSDAARCMNRPVNLALRPVLACLPAWFRFAQCLRRYRDTREAFPHLANATKYATTFFVVLFSTLFNVYRDSYPSSSSHPFFILWILSAVVSSCFTYTWDVKMDWGLFDSNAGDNRFLREEIVYSSPGYYYFAILTDLALRFGWTLSVSLTELGVIHSDLMVTILAPLEVFRRFVWNFFRLENEHLNNCGKFRAVRDISVAPIDAGNQALLVRMMDEPCGVVNRGGRRDLRKRTNKHKKSSPETKILLDSAEGDDTADV
ncbi:xenotropic and polytropic retrovirus receptor 1-like isoform X2 [Rhipicephalus sanguineus]|uniref:xenotropic and polytropic retrovirus receptor 1-like isoform X2 n=1 Tax=Rhipicephalus sanguineus TaxID=34632 RepID=UPI001896145C|nr:xenotropic and polytropic retrovirus receptor 1-like isoform X2 [Rhipicephalus sanguineus]